MKNNFPEKILIYGCGGHSRSIADVIVSLKLNIKIVFVDENAQENEKLFGFPVLKEINELSSYYCIIAIGDNSKRKVKFEEIEKKCKIISVISKTAYLGFNSQVEKGSFIANNAYIGPEVRIKKNCIINTGAVIEHEVAVGENCHIAPAATICGRTKIGNSVFVGVGATIIDKINICSDVIIGAGATVTRNIDEPGVYVGTPAKKILF